MTRAEGLEQTLEVCIVIQRIDRLTEVEIVDRAVKELRAHYNVGTRSEAAAALPHWQDYPRLAGRQIREVLDQFGPLPAANSSPRPMPGGGFISGPMIMMPESPDEEDEDEDEEERAGTYIPSSWR